MDKAESHSTPLSRRTLIRATAATAAIAAAPALAADVEISTSDPLVTLVARRLDLYELAKPYWARTAALEDRIEQLETLSGHTPQSAYDAVSEEYEIAVEEREKLTQGPICDIEKEIAETPAVTMEGAIAKARFMVDYLAVYELDFDGETNPFEFEMNAERFIGVSLALDIDRLTKGGAS